MSLHKLFLYIFQLAEFRQLVEGLDSETDKVVRLEDNWRPPQPLEGRTVYASFIPEVAYEVVKEKVKDYQDEKDSSTSLVFMPLTLLLATTYSIFYHLL